MVSPPFLFGKSRASLLTAGYHVFPRSSSVFVHCIVTILIPRRFLHKTIPPGKPAGYRPSTIKKRPRRVCARRRKESGNHFLRRRVRRRKYRSARKRAKGVPFVRCSEPQPLSNESPVKRVSFESLPKPRFGQAHPAGGNRRDRYQGSCVGSAASAGSVGSAGSADTFVGVDGSAAPS